MTTETDYVVAPFVIDIDFRGSNLGYTFDTSPERLAALKKVNIFVGPNNSGKSRLVRAMLTRVLEKRYVPHSSKAEKYWRYYPNSLAILKKETDKGTYPAGYTKVSNILRTLVLPTFVETPDQNIGNSLDTSISQLPDDPCGVELKAAKSILTEPFFASLHNPIDLRLVYVPTVRGFRSPPNNATYSSERFRGDYFGGTGEGSLSISCGGDMYKRLKERLLGNKSHRKSISDFEKFLSNNFFDGLGVTLIPHENEQQIYVTVGKEKERMISNLGDGLQHLISILFPVFIDRRPTIQAVEEPELFLHPGFQTKLLDCYLQPELSHVQLLATTHSNHLVNLTLDRTSVSVFRVKKEVKPDSEDVEPTFSVQYFDAHAREALGDLGAQRSSLLLSNCVIFVEGPSDRAYFQRFIELYCDRLGFRCPAVDLHYSFLEYGGSNLSSYNFLSNDGKVDPCRLIGSEFLVVIDTDTSEKKRERAKMLEDAIGSKLIRFDAVEVENLLGPTTLSRVVTEYEGSQTPLLHDLKWIDYKDERLGSFIESKLGAKINRKTRSKRPYADAPLNENDATSGKPVTLKDKTDFCVKALSYLNRHEDMTDEALKLAESLHDFICTHNPVLRYRR